MNALFTVQHIIWDIEDEGLLELLQFAQEHKDWTVKQRQKLMWSDESSFQ